MNLSCQRSIDLQATGKRATTRAFKSNSRRTEPFRLIHISLRPGSTSLLAAIVRTRTIYAGIVCLRHVQYLCGKRQVTFPLPLVRNLCEFAISDIWTCVFNLLPLGDNCARKPILCLRLHLCGTRIFFRVRYPFVNFFPCFYIEG